MERVGPFRARTCQRCGGARLRFQLDLVTPKANNAREPLPSACSGHFFGGKIDQHACSDHGDVRKSLSRMSAAWRLFRNPPRVHLAAYQPCEEEVQSY